MSQATRRGLVTMLTGVSAVGAVGFYLATGAWDSSLETNQRPDVQLAPEQVAYIGPAKTLECDCVDDGKPLPAALSCQWVDVAGPAAVGFGTPMACSTTATFSAEGTYEIECTCCDQGPAVECTGDSDVASTIVTVTDALDLEGELAEVGSSVALWYEIPATLDATVTVSSGEITAWANRVGSPTITAASGTLRPAYVASGGPGDEPYAQFDSDDELVNISSIAPQGYYGLYSLHRPRETFDGTRRIVTMLHSGGVSSAISGSYSINFGLTSGTTSPGANLIFPSLNAGWWTLAEMRAQATGASAKIHGGVTEPAMPASTAEMAAVTLLRLGSPSVYSSADHKALWLIANPTDAADAVLKAYVEARWPGILAARPAVMYWGQSNANSLPLYLAPPVPGFEVLHAAVSGTPIADWVPGGTYHSLLMSRVDHTAGQPLIVPMSQGEADSGSEALADAYYDRLDELHASIVAQRGSDTDLFYILITLNDAFRALPSKPYAIDVDARKTDWVADDPAHRQLIDIMMLDGMDDVDPVDGIPDGIDPADSTHYTDPFKVTYMAEISARATVIAAGLGF